MNTLQYNFKDGSTDIGSINISQDEIFDPIMAENTSIQQYIDNIIESNDIDDVSDPLIIIAEFDSGNPDTKRLGSTRWSLLREPLLTSDTYNREKFEKLYFKCNSNVDWPQASSQANLDEGLLMSLRIQFPPLSEGYVKWSNLHSYIMDINNKLLYRRPDAEPGFTEFEYYIIPIVKHARLPGVVSYGFYIHDTQFERPPAARELAITKELYDQSWNVSASHCQPEQNWSYKILKHDGTSVEGSPELFNIIDNEFRDTVRMAVQRSNSRTTPRLRRSNAISPSPVLTRQEAEEVLDALASDDENSTPVRRNLMGEFDESDENSESVRRNLNEAFDASDDEEDDFDVINIYPDNQEELEIAIKLYCEDREQAIGNYGELGEWRIIMHSFDIDSFNFTEDEDSDDEDDEDDAATIIMEEEEESDEIQDRTPPRLSLSDLEISEIQPDDIPRTPEARSEAPELRLQTPEQTPRGPREASITPVTPVREPTYSGERRVMTIDEFKAMIYKNREDWLEGEHINLAEETTNHHHRDNIIIRLTNREELNKAFKLTRDMVEQAFQDEEKISNDEMDEEIYPYFTNNTPYKFDWDVSGVVDFSKLGEDFIETAELASESLEHIDGFYWPKNLEHWDMSSAADLSEMFKGCTYLEYISLKNWGDKLGNVINASSMFEGCTEYNDDLSSWNVSSFTMINNMFKNCYEFEGDFSTWIMPNLISCSGFIRANYPQEKIPDIIFNLGCMERSSDEQSDEDRDDLFLAGGSLLDKKIKHLENYLRSNGYYFLPKYVLEDLQKVEDE